MKFSLAAVAGAACLASTCYAQAPGGDPLPRFVLPPLTEQGPVDIQVNGFAFEGNTVFASSVLQALVADSVGRRLDPSELDEVRNRINRLYVEAGYVNSGALLGAMPPGGYAQGIVPLRIVEGRVSQLRVRGLEGLDQRYLESRLLPQGEVLNLDRLQDRLRLLLADPLFRTINSRVVPGEAPGAAVLDIDLQRAPAFALEVFVNNHRPPSTGATAAGLHTVLRNLTGHGDALEATLQHTRGADPMHLGWSLPVPGSATRLFASYDRSVSAVIEESLAAIDIRSSGTGVAVGAAQVLSESLARRVEVALSFGRRASRNTLLGQPFSFTAGEADGVSEVRVWRFSQDWTQRWEQHALAARSVLALGRNNVQAVDADALTGPADALPPRRYRVWTGQLQHVRTAPDRLGELRLRAHLQYTPDRLLPLEQFAVGGMGSVRGYRENALLRDRGFAASAEYRYPLQRADAAGAGLSVLSFVDLGGGANVRAPWQRLASVGAGLSWQGKGFGADLSYARSLVPLAIRTRGNLQDRGIQFQLSYKLL